MTAPEITDETALWIDQVALFSKIAATQGISYWQLTGDEREVVSDLADMGLIYIDNDERICRIWLTELGQAVTTDHAGGAGASVPRQR